MGRFLLPFLVLTGILIALFFPVSLDVYSHADLNRKKFTFAVYLYGIWKLYGGYLSAYHGGLAIHTGERKVKLLPYSNMDSERKKQIKFYRAMRLNEFSVTSETGAEYMLPVGMVHTVFKATYFRLGGEKEKGEIWLTDGDILRVSTKLRAVFNGYTVLKMLVKTVKEKIQTYVGKKQKN